MQASASANKLALLCLQAQSRQPRGARGRGAMASIRAKAVLIFDFLQEHKQLADEPASQLERALLRGIAKLTPEQKERAHRLNPSCREKFIRCRAVQAPAAVMSAAMHCPHAVRPSRTLVHCSGTVGAHQLPIMRDNRACCREDPRIKGSHTTSKALRMLVDDNIVPRSCADPRKPAGGKGNPYEYMVRLPMCFRSTPSVVPCYSEPFKLAEQQDRTGSRHACVLWFADRR